MGDVVRVEELAGDLPGRVDDDVVDWLHGIRREHALVQIHHRRPRPPLGDDVVGVHTDEEVGLSLEQHPRVLPDPEQRAHVPCVQHIPRAVDVNDRLPRLSRPFALVIKLAHDRASWYKLPL